MDHRKDKLILVDCDGVLLDWGYSFYKWMEESNGLEVMEEGVYNVATTFHITKSETPSNTLKCYTLKDTYSTVSLRYQQMNTPRKQEWKILKDYLVKVCLKN